MPPSHLGEVNYITLARKLSSMPPATRKAILWIVETMNSSKRRKTIILITTAVSILAVAIAMQTQVPPTVAWLLFASGAITGLVFILRFLKIL